MLNGEYDGAGNTSLFDADDVDGVTSDLGVGDVVVIRIPVTFTPGDDTSFDLDAEVMADSSAGEVGDVAADDVASGEDEPAEISIEPIGILGIAQSASPPVELTPSADPADRCEASACETTLTINLENSGNTELNEVLVDQLLGGPNGFPEGTQIVIRAISTSGDISGENVALVDQVFTVGVDDPISLLDGTGSLPVGGSGEIELVVEFTLPQGTVLESFDLSAVGEATDENGASVSDASDNGSAVDANGNGPADDSDPTPLKISSQPIIGVVAKANETDSGSSIQLLDAGDPNQDLETRELTYGASFQVDIAGTHVDCDRQ